MIQLCKTLPGNSLIKLVLILSVLTAGRVAAQGKAYQPLIREHTANTATSAEPTVLALGTARKSNRGVFMISVTSDLDPVVINQFHNWNVHVKSADGQPVEEAIIEISGGMPAHDHDMPTVPAVTSNMGNGDYLVEGMSFHMPGAWQVMLYISSGKLSDTVVLDLVVE